VNERKERLAEELYRRGQLALRGRPRLRPVKCPGCGETAYDPNPVPDPSKVYVCPYCFAESRPVPRLGGKLGG
jgi:hypothetical protein